MTKNPPKITYNFLSEMVGKKKTTISQYFSRCGMSVTSWKDVKTYLKKFL